MNRLKIILLNRGHLFMTFGLTIGLVFSILPILGFDLIYFPGDMGDGRLNLIFLEHAHKFFTGQLITSYWDITFMHPEPNVLAYSDNLIGSAPFYSIFRALGYDIYSAYQAWFITVSALNYISAFYFLKYVFKNNYTAVIGAFIFAFSIALQSQMTHAQTFPRFAIPLAFLMAYKFGESYKIKDFFLTILFVVYEIYCAIYLGFMLVIPIAIFLISILIKHYKKEGKFDKIWFLKLLAAGVVNLLILLPLMLPYMGRSITPNFGHLSHLLPNVPTFKSYFFSQKGSLIWDFLSQTANDYRSWWNHQIFAGGVATLSYIAVIIIIAYKLIAKKFKDISLIQRLILSGIITLFLYLRFYNISAYTFIYFLPGFSSMRALQRIINIELIFFAIATVFILNKFFKKKPLINLILFTVLFSLTVTDNYFNSEKTYRFSIAEAKERTETLDSILVDIPKYSIISVEPSIKSKRIAFTQIDAMLMAQKHDLKCINGYTATSPKGYSSYWNNPNPESRNKWLQVNKAKFDALYIIDPIKKTVEITSINFKD